MTGKIFSRRSFFKIALTSAVSIPLLLKETAKAAACNMTPPAGKPIAKVGEGMAKSLNYVEDSTKSTHAKHKAGNSCAECKFFNKAKIEGSYAPCTMMGMKYVVSCGWCTSFALKA